MKFLKFAFAAFIITAPIVASAQGSTENANWFVLRNEATGDCWTGLLIDVNGEFAHAFAQLASPAYDTKQEALEREAVLAADGTCTVSQ